MAADRTTELRIRRATGADRAAVDALLAAADLPLQGVGDQFEDGFVVAERNGDIVGAAGLETYDNCALLRSVVVHPNQRGRRVGEQLVTERLEWAGAHGIDEVYLLTTTAAPFFDRLGFSTIARTDAPPSILQSSEFAETCPSTATAMARRVATG